MTKTISCQAGFTISELLVVMAVAVILWTLASITLLRPQAKVNLDTVVSTLAADIKAQQTKAMTGDGENSYGIHFEANQYTLFTGSVYSSSDPSNFVVKVDAPVQIINISLPGNELIFQEGSGETGVVPGNDGLTVQNSFGGSSKSLQINKYGTIQEN